MWKFASSLSSSKLQEIHKEAKGNKGSNKLKNELVEIVTDFAREQGTRKTLDEFFTTRELKAYLKKAAKGKAKHELEDMSKAQLIRRILTPKRPRPSPDESVRLAGIAAKDKMGADRANLEATRLEAVAAEKQSKARKATQQARKLVAKANKVLAAAVRQETEADGAADDATSARGKARLLEKAAVRSQKLANQATKDTATSEPKVVKPLTAYWTFQLYFRRQINSEPHKWNAKIVRDLREHGVFVELKEKLKQTDISKWTSRKWASLTQTQKNRYDPKKREAMEVTDTKANPFIVFMKGAGQDRLSALVHDALWLRGQFSMFKEFFPTLNEQMVSCFLTWFQEIQRTQTFPSLLYTPYGGAAMFDKLVASTFSICETLQTRTAVLPGNTWGLEIQVPPRLTFHPKVFAVFLNFVFKNDRMVNQLMADATTQRMLGDEVNRGRISEQSKPSSTPSFSFGGTPGFSGRW